MTALAVAKADERQAKPFLRWVGAKRWLAPALAPWITSRLSGRGVYCEPFLGAGAVALALPAHIPKRLGDRCVALSGLWWWLQRGLDVDAVARCFASWTNTREGYDAVARDFNEEGHFNPRSVIPSIRMLWLNHTCFNGVYRENLAGKYNVPWGKRKTIALPTDTMLMDVNRGLALSSVFIGADYEVTLRSPLPVGSVVYADPPYDGTFVGYTEFGFNAAAQVALANRLVRLVGSGTAVATTNADTPLIRELYPTDRWDVQAVAEPRSVAAKGTSRARAPCLLITSR